MYSATFQLQKCSYSWSVTDDRVNCSKRNKKKIELNKCFKDKSMTISNMRRKQVPEIGSRVGKGTETICFGVRLQDTTAELIRRAKCMQDDNGRGY